MAAAGMRAARAARLRIAAKVRALTKESGRGLAPMEKFGVPMLAMATPWPGNVSCGIGMGVMPGAARNKELLSKVNDKDLDRAEAIVRSMTPEERRNPKIINGSRRLRIAINVVNFAMTTLFFYRAGS